MRRLSFTLEQLRSFVAVAENEHVSRAAASLYLTQAAVTQQVRHFERALGLPLLERHGRRVRLTAAGRSLAESCRAALRGVDLVEEAAQAMKHLESGSLHLGGSPTCATYYLPQHLADFARRNPNIRLELTIQPSVELNRAVVAGTLDCAVIGGVAGVGLMAFELARDEVVVVAHRDHPLSQMSRVTPSSFRPYRYLGPGAQLSAGRTARSLLGDAYEQTDAMNLGHVEYIRAAALAGLGYAVLSRRAVASDLSAGLLKLLPIQPIVRAINAVRRPGTGSPALEAFWDLLTGVETTASARISADGHRRS